MLMLRVSSSPWLSSSRNECGESLYPCIPACYFQNASVLRAYKCQFPVRPMNLQRSVYQICMASCIACAFRKYQTESIWFNVRNVRLCSFTALYCSSKVFILLSCISQKTGSTKNRHIPFIMCNRESAVLRRLSITITLTVFPGISENHPTHRYRFETIYIPCEWEFPIISPLFRTQDNTVDNLIHIQNALSYPKTNRV